MCLGVNVWGLGENFCIRVSGKVFCHWLIVLRSDALIIHQLDSSNHKGLVLANLVIKSHEKLKDLRFVMC